MPRTATITPGARTNGRLAHRVGTIPMPVQIEAISREVAPVDHPVVTGADFSAGDYLKYFDGE